MKQILDFFKKYWKTSAIISCVLLLTITLMCSNANFRNNQRILFQTELINAKETLRDSINEVNNKKLILFQDSVQKVEKIRSDAAKKRADQWEAKANKLDKQNQKLQNNVDSLLTQYGDSLDTNCTKVVTAYQEQVNGLKDEKDALNEEINELNLVVTADSVGLDACNKANIIKDQTIKSKVDLLKIREDLNKDLTKQLAKQNNWFNKNKVWIGLGTGLGLGILIVK